jgi:hypothetical protein
MNATPEPRPPRSRGAVSPFAVFGVVAALAVGGAVWEMLYYAATPALSSASLGTTLGIVAAVVVFFILALTAPPNE